MYAYVNVIYYSDKNNHPSPFIICNNSSFLSYIFITTERKPSATDKRNKSHVRIQYKVKQKTFYNTKSNNKKKRKLNTEIKGTNFYTEDYYVLYDLFNVAMKTCHFRSLKPF